MTEREKKATTEHREPTLFAAFDDPGQAEKAAGALIDHGVHAERISLVVNKEVETHGTPADMDLDYTHPTIVSHAAGATGRFDSLGNDLRQSTPTPILGGNNGPVGESAELDLNPAQNDYPRSDQAIPTEFASRPPGSKSDFNPNLDTREYNSRFDRDVERENNRERDKDRDRQSLEAVAREPDEGLDVNRSDNPRSIEEGDRTIGPSSYDSERAAKLGVTTTTIDDAASAAKKGVVAGLGVGALAAAAAIFVPGIGLVVGGGALATALAAIAASAGAGAVAAGVVGYLKDQGVPASDIPRYQQTYESGGAILAVELTDESDRRTIEQLLHKYGATSVDRYGYAA